MKILGIETSSKICAVALSEDDKLIKEKILEDENTHSVKLMPLVDELLKETKVNIKDIDLLACDKGPGSFTGIRIGIATIKAFVDVTNKNVIGITSLETLAYNVEQDGIICAIIDAKNENVYCGFFERNENEIKQIEDLQFENINNILKHAKELSKKIVFVGNASEVYKDMIKSELNDKAIFLDDREKNKLNARNINLAAFNKKEKAGDTNSLIPMYLRVSSAERQKFEK